MHKPNSGITPEGIPSIGLCALATLAFALLSWWFLALVFLGLTAFSCHFFRDPERVVPTLPEVSVSPADGKVIKISQMADPFTGEMRQCVCIFMNVFSVHVNRSPVAGKVKSIAYHPGDFINAAFDKASSSNERCAYALTDGAGQEWSMVQIAGLIARRIVCRVQEGESLERGERFGMIKFGSRVDVYLPDNHKPIVHIGQQVFAGQTILTQKENA